MGNNTRNIGLIGENIAIRYLLDNGYRILDRNFRVKTGEIDIVAQTLQTIVFIEVKARTSTRYGKPYEAVNYRKQQKIIRVAENYIKFKGLTAYDYRFDIIEVYLNADSKINHIQNAFWAN